ncbi:hypothetical protein VTK73DRAFT_9083 [Phialemonium thermophilum]|uniref:Aminotransferase class I/classII large domain-containing protein n=1 Tax=Phialemonium thermophilum TaxID=223376 RepID=A0ABR3W4S2_9PEZI
MLSARALKTSSQLDIPWRFVPGGPLYDPERNPDAVISFATAENALVHQEVADFVNSRVTFSASTFTYSFSTGGGPQFPKVLAAHLNEFFAPYKELDGHEIINTGAATALHEILAFSLGDPGDGVLLSRPGYGRFELDFGNKAHMSVVWSDTEAENCCAPEVVEYFEKTLGESNEAGVKIRMLFISNPHNPLGRCYPRETLVAIMKFCQRHQIHFVSDEIYALSVFDSGESDTLPFTSVLSIDPTGIIDTDLVHVTYGMSKDYGCAGLRVGALITRNQSLLKSAKSIVRFHNPSGPSLAIATAMLEDRAWCRAFLANTQAKIAEAYGSFTKELRNMGIRYLPGSNAGLFLWVDFTPYLPPEHLSHEERQFSLAQKILDSGVFVQPGEEHALRPGWFRLVYTLDPRAAREGLRRLKAVLQHIKW